MPNQVNGKKLLTKTNTKEEQPRIFALLKVEQKWETLEGSIEMSHFWMNLLRDMEKGYEQWNPQCLPIPRVGEQFVLCMLSIFPQERAQLKLCFCWVMFATYLCFHCDTCRVQNVAWHEECSFCYTCSLLLSKLIFWQDVEWKKTTDCQNHLVYFVLLCWATDLKSLADSPWRFLTILGKFILV